MEGGRIMLKRFLFETKLGEALLTFLERKGGLALTAVDNLASEISGRPTATS
jgi:hypothetical protein